MQKLTFLFVALFFFLIQPLHAQNAADFMPQSFDSRALFLDVTLDEDGNPVDDLERSLRLTDIEIDGDTGAEIYVFNECSGRAICDDNDSALIRTFSRKVQGDVIHVGISEILNVDFLEDFDFSLEDLIPDFDPDQTIELVRLSESPGSSWQILDVEQTLPVPDDFDEFLPDGINLEDELDISLSLDIRRLEDETLSLDFGDVNAVAFLAGWSLDITVYVSVPIIDPIPATLNLLSEYGPVFYFAEGLGQVSTVLEPKSIEVNEDAIGLDEEIARLPGFTSTMFAVDDLTSAEDTPGHNLPEAISLGDNYPNPFNPSTMIPFSVNQPGYLTLEIFDVKGRLIYTVFRNTYHASGTHNAAWDAVGPASGLYFYRLTWIGQTDRQTEQQTGSMLLIK